MKYFGTRFHECPYCGKICIIELIYCCNNHKYLFEEKKIEKMKIEGRWRE
jgi:hypothetical protein